MKTGSSERQADRDDSPETFDYFLQCRDAAEGDKKKMECQCEKEKEKRSSQKDGELVLFNSGSTHYWLQSCLMMSLAPPNSDITKKLSSKEGNLR